MSEQDDSINDKIILKLFNMMLTTTWMTLIFSRFLSDKENGMLVEPDDANALAEAIMEIAVGPRLAHNMAEKGFGTVTDSFSLKRMNDDLLKVYRRVLG